MTFSKFTVVWPVFDAVAMSEEAFIKLFSCMSNIGTLCSVNYFPFLAVSSKFYLFRYVANQQLYSNVPPCGKCKFFSKINIVKLITSNKLNITEKIKGTGNCKGREIIYATQSSKHKVLYIGHTGEQLSECFSKHRYNIKHRPTEYWNWWLC